MKKLYTCFFLSVVFLMPMLLFAQTGKYHRIRVAIDPQRLEYLFNHGLDVDHFSYENKRDFTAEVSDADVALFRRAGVKVTYLVRDLEKNYRAINARIDRAAAQSGKARVAAVSTPVNFSLGSYAGYYAYTELPAILDRMRTLYPNLISVRSSIGNSVQGRPLYIVKISDNPDVDENEPELLLNALHHAREPMSLSQLIFFMWHVLENYNSDKEIRTLLNSSEIYILPCVNPDGYVYNQTTNPNGGGLWRKNRRTNADGTFGVDLNRNYSYNYALDNTGSSPTPSSDTYRGTGAFSEPETAALRAFSASRQFVTAFNYHSYSNVCIYPFESLNPNSNAELSTFRSAATYLTADNGFKIGNAYETVGYKANGTAPDWEFGEQVAKSKIYGFTPEIGSSTDGFWPASSRIIPLSNTMIEMNRRMLRISTYYGRATVSGPLSITQPGGTAVTLAYQFQNFSIKPASYTVATTSLSPALAISSPSRTFSGQAMLQSSPGSLSFTVDASTPTGTLLPFEIAVDNGLSVIRDTVTLTFSPSCGTPSALTASPITETSATLGWLPVSGATSYAVSVKPKSTTAWPADVLVSTNSYAVTGLINGTDYDWRVKPTCGTYAVASFKTLLQTCFRETGGQVVFEAENYRTAVAGTGAAAGRVWSPLSSSTASGGQAMSASGTGLNLQNNLVGPRLDYAINFTTAGTYYVWVRMAAGPSTTSDDSFHLGLNGTAVTLSPSTSNYNNGSTAWTWLKAAGSTAFRIVISTPGSYTFNLWMREDGVRIDKFVLTTSATYTPTGTGPAMSSSCNSPLPASSRLSASVDETELDVIAYPNPFDDNITVKLSPNGQDSEGRLIGADGRSYLQFTIPGTESERILGTRNLPAGAYFIEIIQQNRRRVVPIRKL